MVRERHAAVLAHVQQLTQTCIRRRHRMIVPKKSYVFDNSEWSYLVPDLSRLMLFLAQHTHLGGPRGQMSGHCNFLHSRNFALRRANTIFFFKLLLLQCWLNSLLPETTTPNCGSNTTRGSTPSDTLTGITNCNCTCLQLLDMTVHGR